MPIKNENIIIRVTKNEKKEICDKARQLGLTTSEYLLRMSENGNITIIEGGKEIAAELYFLNQHLSKIEKCPVLPIQELRDIASSCIVNLNKLMKK